MGIDVDAAREFFRIIGSGNRLTVMLALDGRELSVSEISERTGMPFMKVSQSLIRMRLNGILEARREGLNVYYRVQSPAARLVMDIVKREFGRDE